MLLNSFIIPITNLLNVSLNKYQDTLIFCLFFYKIILLIPVPKNNLTTFSGKSSPRRRGSRKVFKNKKPILSLWKLLYYEKNNLLFQMINLILACAGVKFIKKMKDITVNSHKINCNVLRTTSFFLQLFTSNKTQGSKQHESFSSVSPCLHHNFDSETHQDSSVLSHLDLLF